MRATFYANKESELARFQFLLDKRDPFKIHMCCVKRKTKIPVSLMAFVFCI